MSHYDALKVANKEIPISKHIKITHLNTPSIFETVDGKIGMVLKIEGVTFEAENQSVLNQYKRSAHKALTMLDDRFSVYVTLHRHQESIKLSGNFENEFSRKLDQAYQNQFTGKNMYVNDIYYTVIFKGITSGSMGKGISILNKIQSKAVKDARNSIRNMQIKELTNMVDQLKTILSSFKPRLLGDNDKKAGFSELIHFLSIFVNGGDGIKVPFTTEYMPISQSLSDNKKDLELYPRGLLSQYLGKKRIFFGEYIQFQGATKDDTTYGAMVTIKQYGNESACIMLDTLLHLDCDFISTNSYIIEPKDISLEAVKRQENRLKSSGDAAKTQISALEIAKDHIASDRITLGYHHNTLMLLTDDIKDLDKKINKSIKCYSDAAFIAIRETIGQEPAFWAQIPSNFKYIARSSLISSENFVDFAPLHNYRTGYIDGNHLGSAATILLTPSKTPYWGNLHIKGSPDNPSKGHTIMIGGNGAGKTVAMSFFDSQLDRYQGNTFYFDRDRGAEIYIRAAGGTYSILSPDFPENTQFSPLQMDDTPANRQFNRDLLIQFCKDECNAQISSEISNMLRDCVNYAYDHLAQEHRTFSNATKILPITFPHWASLRRWLRGDGTHEDGEYAYIFDNTHDSLKFSSKMGFDMTHFLDKEPEQVRTPVMMYLFERIDHAIAPRLNNSNGATGNLSPLTRVILDEGWQYFIDAYWKGRLTRALPTWRKYNGQLIMATQSPSSVVKSPLKSLIMDNVATQIYFTNPQAEVEDYIDGLKLTRSEYDIVKNSEPSKRIFLFKQENESTRCTLNLGGLGDYLAVLSGNTGTVKLLDSIRKEVGDDPNIWLPIFHEKRLHLRSDS